MGDDVEAILLVFAVMIAFVADSGADKKQPRVCAGASKLFPRSLNSLLRLRIAVSS
jgi:hypothetical protein